MQQEKSQNNLEKLSKFDSKTTKVQSVEPELWMFKVLSEI